MVNQYGLELNVPTNINEKYPLGRGSGSNHNDLAGNKSINLNFLNSKNINIRLTSSKNKQNMSKNNS